jgi:TatD DNase family protein
MREEQAENGVRHCFSEVWETAKAAMDLGFYISFSRNVNQ